MIQHQDDKRELIPQKVIEKWKNLSKEIKNIDYIIDDDSSGDPSVNIFIFIVDESKPSSERIMEMSRVERNIKRDIFEMNTKFWPYVSVVSE